VTSPRRHRRSSHADASKPSFGTLERRSAPQGASLPRTHHSHIGSTFAGRLQAAACPRGSPRRRSPRHPDISVERCNSLPITPFRVTIKERPETVETDPGESPLLRSSEWSGDAIDKQDAIEQAWADFDLKHGTDDRPAGQVDVVDELEQYRVPETSDLESAARRYIVGRVTRQDLAARAQATDSGDPDDALLTVIFQNSADQSTEQGLKAALRRHFES
jgi:hypothetical protein